MPRKAEQCIKLYSTFYDFTFNQYFVANKNIFYFVAGLSILFTLLYNLFFCFYDLFVYSTIIYLTSTLSYFYTLTKGNVGKCSFCLEHFSNAYYRLWNGKENKCSVSGVPVGTKWLQRLLFIFEMKMKKKVFQPTFPDYGLTKDKKLDFFFVCLVVNHLSMTSGVMTFNWI